MKKLMLSLLATGVIFFSSQAQDKAGKKDCKPHKHHKGMAMKNMNFSEDQIKQIQANKESYKQELKELDNKNLSAAEYRAKKEALKNEKKAKMQAILTPEQKARMEQAKKDKHQKHEANAEQRMEKMKSHLNLTNDQVAKIKAENEAIHEKMKAIKDNSSLTREQKKEQLTALKESKRESFKKVLTAEQLSKMEELKKKKMERVSKT